MKRFAFGAIAILYLFLTATNGEAINNEDLILNQIHVIFRHGARTPTALYPNDPYRLMNYTFVEGLGQLTSAGKQQLYTLGQVLRKRYAHFVENITTQQIHARSTNSRRCLESSLALLAGFFPPQNRWSQTEELAKLWQPIPVETVDLNEDYLLNPLSPCPVANKIEATIANNPVVKKCIEENKSFICELESHTGQKIKWWLDIATIYDSIRSEMEYFGPNFHRPKWLDAIGKNTMKRMYDIGWVGMKAMIQSSKQYTKLRAGAFIDEMLTHFKDSDKYLGHVFTYATHDIQIMNLLQAFGAFKSGTVLINLFPEPPTYGSGLIVELYRTPNRSTEQVHLYYLNATNNFDIYALNLSQTDTFQGKCGHSTTCTLAEFSVSLHDYRLMTGEIKQECGFSQESTSTRD